MECKSSNLTNYKYNSITDALALIAEYRDSYTGIHLQRIKSYVKIITDYLEKNYPSLVRPDYAEEVVSLSVIHDIGKVAIPDNILLKEGSLTQEEFSIMKTHASVGAEILQQIPCITGDCLNKFQIAYEIAKFHHERFDGSGYPDGQKGNEIPLHSQIVALADVYDALTSKRKYKLAFSHEYAKQCILLGDKKTKPVHFNPLLLEAFIRSNDFFRAELNQF